jgi:sec-independent protein translocase protein TatC
MRLTAPLQKLRGARSNKSKVRTPDDRMTLVEHLTELRTRVIRCALAVFLGATVAFIFYGPLLDFLERPYADLCASNEKYGCDGTLTLIGPLSGFSTRTSVSFYAGLVVGLPVIVWQIWQFVTPALYKHEKRYAPAFIISTFLLFAMGVTLGWITFPAALRFLLDFAGNDVTATFEPRSYVNLILLVLLAFGVSFLFPVVLVFAQMLGILQYRTLVTGRRYAAVIIVAAAAVITPSGDPISLAAMAVPMYLFYEVSILIGWFIHRRRTKREAAEAAG